MAQQQPLRRTSSSRSSASIASSATAIRRSSSAVSAMMSSTNVKHNNNNKPPAVPRNSLIRSSSNSQQITSVSFNKDSLIKVDFSNQQQSPPVALSRSFTFESAGGVRRKIPISPVLSTSGSSRSSSVTSSSGVYHQSNALNRHDTLHYRQGTLVFPSSNNVVVGRLELSSGVQASPKTSDVIEETPLEVEQRKPNVVISSTSSTIKIRSSSLSHAPGQHHVTSSLLSSLLHHLPGRDAGHHGTKAADERLLKLCQEGDAGTVSGYLSQLGIPSERIPSRIVNAVDSSGKSALIHSAMTGNVPIVRMLVKLPALDVNLADNEGNTAIHLASQAGHADVVSLLTLCPNLVIDSRNHMGITALMKAALQGRVRCTRLLLLAGASPALRDFGRGACALEWAKLTGRTKCVEIIDKYMDKMQLNPGLKPVVQNKKGANTTGGVWTSSEPSLLLAQQQMMLGSSKTSNISLHTQKDSWVKSTLKKALQIVGSKDRINKDPFGGDGVIASQLTGTSFLDPVSILALPNSEAGIRRASLPSLLPSSSEKSPYWSLKSSSIFSSSSTSRSPDDSLPKISSDGPVSFVIPKIQVTVWSSEAPGRSIPPPPTARAPPIPASIRSSEMRPEAPVRSRSKSFSLITSSSYLK